MSKILLLFMCIRCRDTLIVTCTINLIGSAKNFSSAHKTRQSLLDMFIYTKVKKWLVYNAISISSGGFWGAVVPPSLATLGNTERWMYYHINILKHKLIPAKVLFQYITIVTF